MESPTPEQIKDARAQSGQTQTVAAKTIHTTQRVWSQWETGLRKMHPAFYELYLIKTNNKE